MVIGKIPVSEVCKKLVGAYTGIKSVKLINNNGSQLLSKDFREVLLSANIQQIRIRRNHPQSNGKIERFNGLVRQEYLRPESPVTVT